MKKILIIDNSAWNIYNFRTPHIKKLNEYGYELLIATPIDEYIGKLKEVPYQQHLLLRHLKPQSKNPFRDILFMFELMRYFKKSKPDLIINFTIKPNIYGSIAARALKIPAISVVTGLGYPFLNPKGINQVIPLLFKISFKRIKKLIVYNTGDKNAIISKGILRREKISIVSGSGINTEKYLPLIQKNKNSKFTFLFIGRLLKDKGILEFAAAAKILKSQYSNLEFCVLGNFNQTNPSAISKGQLYTWVKNGFIKYNGFANDVRPYIRNADVMVLPSRREGLSRSILEAMSMEKPIITTKVPGCQETVEHGVNGFLVPVKCINSLTEAMLAAYETKPKEFHAMGQASRVRAKQLFNDEIVATRFANLVKEVLPLPETKSKKNECQTIF